MNYVLQKDQQEKFIKCLIDAKENDEIEMKELLEGCIHFSHQVHGNSYFLSKSNESEIRKRNVPANYISNIYGLTEQYYFFLEEMSSDFIDFILHNNSESDLSIDENISNLHYSYLTRYE